MEFEKALATLRCMVTLEEAVAELYERLARVVGMKNVSAALAFVAQESRNHAKLIESLFGKPSSEECTSELGTWGAATISKLKNLTVKLDEGWAPSLEQIADLLEDLCGVEKFSGEEVYTQIIATALVMYFSGLEKTLLASVAEEEEMHREILKQVIRELRELAGKHE